MIIIVIITVDQSNIYVIIIRNIIRGKYALLFISYSFQINNYSNNQIWIIYWINIIIN